MKPPRFDPSWPADVLALYRHDMQEIWDPSIAPQIWNQYHNQLSDDNWTLSVITAGAAGVAGLLPAYRASRVRIAEALHEE